MSPTLRALIMARKRLKLAVLQAAVADEGGDFTEKFEAWREVDAAAAAVATAARKYKKHCREVGRKVFMTGDGPGEPSSPAPAG